uniref:TBC domain-containing protein n=1 Tax=Spironucleus salmonicida TaxID=348837 RepID=V6LTK3_9EUKA|eukprot:EST47915.1 TBC domain-containing protein [Spironucleus salmonicida]
MDKIQPEQRIFIYKQVFSETSLPKKIIDDYMKASAKTQQEAKVFKTTIYPKKSVPYHEINFKNLDRLELPVDIYNRSLLYTTFLGAQTLQTARDLLYRVKLLPMNAEFNLVHDRDILETQFLASNYVQQHSMLLADIDRTFSSLWLFQAGQLLFHPLNNVVCAAILHNNFYVQGLSLLTAVLLLSADTEEQALALVLHYCGSRGVPGISSRLRSRPSRRTPFAFSRRSSACSRTRASPCTSSRSDCRRASIIWWTARSAD